MENTILPNGAAGAVTDLSRVVQESKKEIEAQKPNPNEKKRGRGRPPGSGRKGRRPMHVANEVHHGQAEQETIESEVAYSPSPLVPMISLGVDMPFNIWAEQTGCEKLKLDRNENQALTLALDHVVNLWMPATQNIDPKWKAVITFSISGGMIFLTKKQILNQHLKEKQEKWDQEHRKSGGASVTEIKPDAKIDPSKVSGDPIFSGPPTAVAGPL